MKAVYIDNLKCPDYLINVWVKLFTIYIIVIIISLYLGIDFHFMKSIENFYF